MSNSDNLSNIIAVMAQKGAEIKPGSRMCKDCAFRAGSAANLEQETVTDAMDALVGDGEFNCHTDDLQDAGHLCAGFVYARQFLQTLENNI